jgi:spore maturation protein CgeB/dTDP-glucose pyrophosphorylase
VNIIIFGLSVSSSWGNGHATLWRGLCRALRNRGHSVIFFEKDVPYYAAHRDFTDFDDLPGIGSRTVRSRLILYSDWASISELARKHLDDADVGIVTSYCPDGLAVARTLFDSRVIARVFYDLDTPVTLGRIRAGEKIDYLPENGLRDFDLVLSYTGGKALDELKSRLGAKNVAPLYGSVDPESHHWTSPVDRYRADLSYLGTYSADRQHGVEELFLEPARILGARRFTLGGSQYPESFPWRENIYFFRHVPPKEHPAFFCSSRLTLNVTRRMMAQMGYCPSGRLFEAASCGVPVVSDSWEGLDRFFEPESEIFIARSAADVVNVIERSDAELLRVAEAARERTLQSHTADRRASEFETLLQTVLAKRAVAPISAAKVWGVIPAAGLGSRIQPLAFSKELLPVGSRQDGDTERPRAVSEFLVERMVRGGASKICFVIAPGKSDILEYYGGKLGAVDLCYAVQPKAAGLCDAIFRAVPFIPAQDTVCIGLPDTIWFPENGFQLLPEGLLSFLLFPVKRPQYFDAVVLNEDEDKNDPSRVLEIQVKQPNPRSSWIWGAFKMPGHVFHELHGLWLERSAQGVGDEYFGTLVNAYLARGGEARGVKAGDAYVDVGTLHGYREAIQLLSSQNAPQYSDEGGIGFALRSADENARGCVDWTREA